MANNRRKKAKAAYKKRARNGAVRYRPDARRVYTQRDNLLVRTTQCCLTFIALYYVILCINWSVVLWFLMDAARNFKRCAVNKVVFVAQVLATTTDWAVQECVESISTLQYINLSHQYAGDLSMYWALGSIITHVLMEALDPTRTTLWASAYYLVSAFLVDTILVDSPKLVFPITAYALVCSYGMSMLTYYRVAICTICDEMKIHERNHRCRVGSACCECTTNWLKTRPYDRERPCCKEKRTVFTWYEYMYVLKKPVEFEKIDGLDLITGDKRCPRCGVGINKNGGCLKMYCTTCHHSFCWMCLEDTPTYNHPCYALYGY